MATMVREKKREKKKAKDKSLSSKTTIKTDLSSQEATFSEKPSTSSFFEITNKSVSRSNENVPTSDMTFKTDNNTINEPIDTGLNLKVNSIIKDADAFTKSKLFEISEPKLNMAQSKKANLQTTQSIENLSQINDTYANLNNKLKRITIPDIDSQVNIKYSIKQLESLDAYLSNKKDVVLPENENEESLNASSLEIILSDESNGDLSVERAKEESSEHRTIQLLENLAPSAPMIEEHETLQVIPQVEVPTEMRPKVQCMPLEQAIILFGGREMAEVRAMSEREEMIVEAGPSSGPEHPLVDLLSTFRSSLMAVERESIKLSQNLQEEEKFRSTLWKIEKRYVNISKTCPCGASVGFKATYDHAELVRERLGVARMRLEALLRDIQESYCHHQHDALLAYSQIEEFVSETVQGSKSDIREALSLTLQALRISDSAPAALSRALQRWARALTAALLDTRDLRQLLFLLHHLFRQTRSVRWATGLIHVPVIDTSDAARAIALLELVLAAPRLAAAQECTEESEELWEEVCGGTNGARAGAVREGALRERDLLSVLRALPRRALLAALAHLAHTNIDLIDEASWGDRGGGAGVLRAACGARALLHVLHGAARAHPQYARLRTRIDALAVAALRVLAALHLRSRELYSQELVEKIESELEAAYGSALALVGARAQRRLPAALLSDRAAHDYCVSLINALHEESAPEVASLGAASKARTCGERAREVARVAAARAHHAALAQAALHFLLHTGVQKEQRCGCAAAARAGLPTLLRVHRGLHAPALHLLAHLCTVGEVEESVLCSVRVRWWRGDAGEARGVLAACAARAALLRHVLLDVDCTPHTGLSLETQLAIGWWLCEWVRASPAPAPQWAWAALRRLRVHRACWPDLVPHHAPAPDHSYTDTFTTIFTVMATSWGHSIPLICSSGVAALCACARSQPAAAAHALLLLLRAMAASPRSLMLTPKFAELVTLILESGPSLVQRALRRGAEPGPALLLRLLLDQLQHSEPGDSRSALVSCWVHALWAPTLPVSALAVLDTAAVAARAIPLLDAHATLLLQEENGKEYMSYAWEACGAAGAPAVCAGGLRAARAREAALLPRLAAALRHQRAHHRRVHVDNALKQIGVNINSEDLVIHKSAAAAVVAPLQHPAHLHLWELFLQLYLTKESSSQHLFDKTPIGPLLFSGLLKSRMLAQIKKRLQYTATYHNTEAETYKNLIDNKKPEIETSSSETTPSSEEKLLFLPSVVIDLPEEQETSDSESESDSSSEDEMEEDKEDSDTEKTEESPDELLNVLHYHVAAEKLTSEYLRWVEAGEAARADPHHAHLSRWIPDTVLSSAWERYVREQRPPRPAGEERAPRPAAPAPPPRGPLRVRDTLRRVHTRLPNRTNKRRLPSLTDDVDFRDPRSVMNALDKHLKDVEKLANEWSTEVSRISGLDAQLLQLVGVLRVPRPLPTITRSCDRHCAPINVTIHDQEWCISTGAERGIKENRASALAAMRVLARPRPLAARTAAALGTIARRVRCADAVAVLRRAWGCARGPLPAPAHRALRALVDDLAERCVCSDGEACARLLEEWCGRAGEAGALRAELAGALVRPRAARARPRLLAALLTAHLPPQKLFSYLSRFEMSRWSEQFSPAEREEMLAGLAAAAQRWGPQPDDQHKPIIEVLDVQSLALTGPHELCAQALRVARALAARRLPLAYCAHVRAAADAHAHLVPFDQLGHLLREVGGVWWAARGEGRGAAHEAAADAHAGSARALQRGLVAAALALSYHADRVSWFAWSTVMEAWGAWVSPLPGAPLLAPADLYARMVALFVGTLRQVMADCPGSEDYLLQQVWEWSIHTYLCVQSAASQVARVHVTTLLVELNNLPWADHQWFHLKCMQSALQVCSVTDKELPSWCARAVRAQRAGAWMRGVVDEHAPLHLAALVHLFTKLPLELQTLNETCHLPWHRLPEEALMPLLEQFFADYYDLNKPYHDLPQFRVVVYASELAPPASGGPGGGPGARLKRSALVSRWTRAGSVPALLLHAPAHANHVLGAITACAPHTSDEELEELLGRAAAIMCVEPAAAAVLPVWQAWVGGAGPRLVAACAAAAARLTAPDYFAALGDTAARAHLAHTECGGWGSLAARWRHSAWAASGPLCARARLHAAYALLRAHPHDPRLLDDAFTALLNANIDFVENEVIVCVWICVLGRAGSSGARAVLARWAEPPRRSLLRAVTMRADNTQPTNKHRLLCRLAVCLLAPSPEASRAYEASRAAVLPAGDVTAPSPATLPALAVHLFPGRDMYFQYELEATTGQV